MEQKDRLQQAAREETIEEICEWLTKHAAKYNSLGVDEMVKDLKVAINITKE